MSITEFLKAMMSISGSAPCWAEIGPSLNRFSREKQAAVYQNPVARLSRFRPAVGTSSNSHPGSRFDLDDVDEIVRIGAAALALGRDGCVGFGLGHGHLENCAHEN